MQRSNLYGIVTSLMILILTSGAVSAQTATATLKGAVRDGGGNALPGATVNLINNSTGFKKTFTTDSGGQYTFTLIEPGFYAVEVQAAGFKTHRQPRLQLEVGQSA